MMKRKIINYLINKRLHTLAELLFRGSYRIQWANRSVGMSQVEIKKPNKGATLKGGL